MYNHIHILRKMTLITLLLHNINIRYQTNITLTSFQYLLVLKIYKKFVLRNGPVIFLARYFWKTAGYPAHPYACINNDSALDVCEQGIRARHQLYHPSLGKCDS